MEYFIKIKTRNNKKKLNKKHVFSVIITFIFMFLIILIIILSNKKEVDNKKIDEINDNAFHNDIVVNLGENEEIVKPKHDFSMLNEQELERIDSIYNKNDPKRIFLTFDDGPTEQVTPYILDLLKNENIKATFFVLGNRVDANPELVKREFEEGHFVANHGYTHKYSSIYASAENIVNEYNQTNQSIRNALQNQEYNSLVFRFPGGSVGGPYDSIKKATKQLLRQQGIASLDWNALTGDSEGIKTKEKLLERFYNTVNNKSSVVLLMHDAADKILTYEVLPSIISFCRENGYEFKNLYDVILREN